MGRIKQYIEVGEKKFWALFDTSARNTYVTAEVSSILPTSKFESLNPVSLGGKTHILDKVSQMQQWGIVCVPEKEDIDMSHYPKEFVEFLV